MSATLQRNGGKVAVYHHKSPYPLEMSEEEACRALLSHADLLEALHGLDANYVGECDGLSVEQWDQRVRRAREAVARAEGRA